MISHIDVRNYQSLHHVELDLLPLTVIVGPSSSGKSALTRAIRTLTSNTRGNKFITHGERLSVLTAKTDKGTLILKRGVSSKDNEYVIIPEDADDKNYPQKSYTKLDGNVPPEVSAFLGIEAKDAINYAGQFDMPYLLSKTAGDVAKTLGSLTNVHIIFKAAAKSKALTNQKASLARTRKEDLALIKAKVQEFRTLKEQRAALTAAETAIDEAKRTQQQILRLTELHEQLEGAQRLIDGLAKYVSIEIPDISSIEKLSKAAARLEELATTKEQAKQSLDKLAPFVSMEIPQLDGVLDANKNLSRFMEILRGLSAETVALRNAAAQARIEKDQLEALQTAYKETLAAAGTCPTCGQDTHKLEDIHV